MSHPLPNVSPRLAIARALARYLETLVFTRSGPPDVLFKLKRVWDEWPDAETRIDYPSASVLPGTAEYDDSLLTPSFVEGTFGQFAPGTALVQQAELTERIQLDIWASSREEREAIVAGIESALNPREDAYGLDLPMPDYYEREASYVLHGVQFIDDEGSARNERRAVMHIDAIAPVVALRHTSLMLPRVTVAVGATLDVTA